MADQPQDEKNSEAPRFGIIAQYIKDVSFENPHSPDVYLKPEGQPQVAVDLDVASRRLENNMYEVNLGIKAKASLEKKDAFLIELVYSGVFVLENFDAAALEPMLLIECPRMLFPFARSVVADITRDGGFPPLMLNPIDFVALYRQQKEAAAKKAPKA